MTVGAYDRDLRSYTANLPAGALADVTGADFVMSIEPVPLVTIAHDSSIPVMGVDGFRSYDPATERFSGITGAGIAVGVIDTALNTNHPDIVHGRARASAAPISWRTNSGTSGSTSTVTAHTCSARSPVRGVRIPCSPVVAPGLSHLRIAKVFQAINGRGSAEDIRRGMDYLSRPTSCSWRGTLSEAVKPLIVNMSLSRAGLEFSGRGVGERKLDSVVHAHSQLYVVAQANKAQQGFSNYGTAKNSLAVGAVDDTGIIARFSSHGPTADGRLAPNVVGTGVSLTSARGGAAESGHRDRAAARAWPRRRSRALRRCSWRRSRSIRTGPPSPAPGSWRVPYGLTSISRAAMRLPPDNTDGPGDFNNLYGLGLVSARTTLFSRDDPEGWLIGSASSEPENGSYEFVDIEVPDGASRLDVVLTWDEQPADTLTRSVLNNLDLWADQGADCDADACGEYSSRSAVDNVEWLLIEDPAPGVPGGSRSCRSKRMASRSRPPWRGRLCAANRLRGSQSRSRTSRPESDSEYVTVEVTVDVDRYVASGTTLSLGCRGTRIRVQPS